MSDENEKEIECNADQDHPCDADDGDPCPSCVKWYVDEDRYWRGKYVSASPEEQDPEKYRDEMIDAGRGRLVR